MITHTVEYKQIETLYQADGNSIVLVYGRDRADKEGLFRELAEKYPVFYYRCRACSEGLQLSYLMKEIGTTFGPDFKENTFEECFRKIRTRDGSKLMLILDEADEALELDGAFLEAVLHLKQKKLYPGPVMIVLAGSSAGYEEKMAQLFESTPKAVAGVVKLNDLSFLDVVRAFPNYTVSDCVSVYGIIGGVAGYLKFWDGTKSIKQNIIDNILSPTGYLYREAERSIAAQLREVSCYNTILASIASGHEKLQELFLDTGYSRAKISVYMKNLAAFDVIEKVVSFETGGWENAKKGVYRISSPHVNFYFNFIYPNLSDLFVMSPEAFYDKYIAAGLSDYLSRYFSLVCREYLTLLNKMGQLPIKLTNIGTWVGKESTIDVVGQSTDRQTVVGICNYSEKEMRYNAYEELIAAAGKAKVNPKAIYLFSATAFDLRLKALASRDNTVILVDMTEL